MIEKFETLEKKEHDNLIWVILAGILTIIFWNIPYASIILFPFKMFVTYIHEASHGIASIISGGELVRFTMQMDTSGLAYTRGGFRVLVISAGYLGSTFLGVLLLLSAFKKGLEKPILGGLGIFFLVFTLLFARNLVAFTTGIFFGLSMLSLLKVKKTQFLSLFLSFLAVQTCFNSFEDIMNLIFLRSCGTTDAHSMSALTAGILPPIFFAVLWGVISISFFIIAFKLSFGDNKKEKKLSSSTQDELLLDSIKKKYDI